MVNVLESDATSISDTSDEEVILNDADQLIKVYVATSIAASDEQLLPNEEPHPLTCRLNCCFNPGPYRETNDYQTDIEEDFLNGIEDPGMRLTDCTRCNQGDKICTKIKKQLKWPI